MAHDAFISYSSVDKTTAFAACATLEQTGIRCWIAPRDITPGSEWSAAIVNAIDNCRVFIIIFSSSANDSRQIRREVERAINAGVPVVPVRIENVVPTEALAYFMSTVHWLDAMSPPLEQHLQKLASSVNALVKLSAPAIAPSAIPTAAVAPGAPGQQASPPMPGAPSAAIPAPDVKPGIRGMFHDLMNFAYKRSALQALGWYLMFFIFGLLVIVAVTQAIVLATSDFGFDTGLRLGNFVAIPYTAVLGGLLLWYRPKTALNVILLLSGVALASFLGLVLGLLPLAILTTRPAFQMPAR
jgi:hypothetical protein